MADRADLDELLMDGPDEEMDFEPEDVPTPRTQELQPPSEAKAGRSPRSERQSAAAAAADTAARGHLAEQQQRISWRASMDSKPAAKQEHGSGKEHGSSKDDSQKKPASFLRERLRQQQQKIAAGEVKLRPVLGGDGRTPGSRSADRSEPPEGKPASLERAAAWPAKSAAKPRASSEERARSSSGRRAAEVASAAGAEPSAERKSTDAAPKPNSRKLSSHVRGAAADKKGDSPSIAKLVVRSQLVKSNRVQEEEEAAAATTAKKKRARGGKREAAKKVRAAARALGINPDGIPIDQLQFQIAAASSDAGRLPMLPGRGDVFAERFGYGRVDLPPGMALPSGAADFGRAYSGPPDPMGADYPPPHHMDPRADRNWPPYNRGGPDCWPPGSPALDPRRSGQLPPEFVELQRRMLEADLAADALHTGRAPASRQPPPPSRRNGGFANGAAEPGYEDAPHDRHARQPSPPPRRIFEAAPGDHHRSAHQRHAAAAEVPPSHNGRQQQRDVGQPRHTAPGSHSNGRNADRRTNSSASPPTEKPKKRPISDAIAALRAPGPASERSAVVRRAAAAGSGGGGRGADGDRERRTAEKTNVGGRHLARDFEKGRDNTAAVAVDRHADRPRSRSPQRRRRSSSPPANRRRTSAEGRAVADRGAIGDGGGRPSGSDRRHEAKRKAEPAAAAAEPSSKRSAVASSPAVARGSERAAAGASERGVEARQPASPSPSGSSRSASSSRSRSMSPEQSEGSKRSGSTPPQQPIPEPKSAMPKPHVYKTEASEVKEWFYRDNAAEVHGPHSVKEFRSWLGGLEKVSMLRTDMKQAFEEFKATMLWKNGSSKFYPLLKVVDY